MRKQVVRPLQFDHVLLQRVDSQHVDDLKVGHLAIRSFGMDKKLVVTAEHPRRDSVVGQLRFIEIRKY
jgi:hypothetical protein